MMTLYNPAMCKVQSFILFEMQEKSKLSQITDNRGLQYEWSVR